jgi:hypothetical protein
MYRLFFCLQNYFDCCVFNDMCRSKQCEDWSGLKRGVHSVPKIITSVKHTKDKYDKEKAPNSDQHTLHKNNGSVTGKRG